MAESRKELSEFDGEAIIKSCTIQDIALAQSYKQRQEDEKRFEEILKEYMKAKEKSAKVSEQHQVLLANITKNLNVQHSITQLQEISNTKTTSIQNEVLALYDEMFKDSDELFKVMKNSLQNVDNEFDEGNLQRKRAESAEKINILKKEIQEKREIYNKLKDAENELLTNCCNNKPFDCILKDFDISKLKTASLEKEKYLEQLDENIKFLEERNREMKIECETLD